MVTRGRQDAHTRGDLHVTIDDRVVDPGKLNPLALDIGNTKKARVVAAADEMQMRVDDQPHLV
jgi:hypothetical protein